MTCAGQAGDAGEQKTNRLRGVTYNSKLTQRRVHQRKLHRTPGTSYVLVTAYIRLSGDQGVASSTTETLPLVVSKV